MGNRRRSRVKLAFRRRSSASGARPLLLVPAPVPGVDLALVGALQQRAQGSSVLLASAQVGVIGLLVEAHLVGTLAEPEQGAPTLAESQQSAALAESETWLSLSLTFGLHSQVREIKGFTR